MSGLAQATARSFTPACYSQLPQYVAAACSGASQSPVLVSGNANAFFPIDCGLIKRIPKSSQSFCKSSAQCCSPPGQTNANWEAILHWGSAILRLPKRDDKKHNLTSCIKKSISDFLPAAGYHLPETAKPANRKSRSAFLLLAQAVAAKLKDSNLEAAIRLLVSDEEPAVPLADAS